MLRNIFKKSLLLLPPIRSYVDHVRMMQEVTDNQKAQIDNIIDLIEKSRSPGLFNSCEEFLTERLLAHPARKPLPVVKLGSQAAEGKPNRVLVADRLLKSYYKSLEDEQFSVLRPEREDPWASLIRNELPELKKTLEEQCPKNLARYLMTFGQFFVWFGGITTCTDGYNRNLDRQQIALTYFDKLVCLGEYLGVLRFESPESGPWGENLHVDVNTLIDEIENEVGIEITPPLGIIHTDGLETSKGLFHYRHINSLYCAIRLAKINFTGDAICELGGGLGITAMYARKMGILNYTILDLPIICLLAGHYLIHAVGEDHVSLYGEDLSDNKVKILPYWECLNIADKSVGLTINQDSLPEMADNFIFEYLK